ncbi:MAG: hypothetical protein GYB64_12510 [Chloroflexi bacterium]|nr:hypothetical protein [Chloroflexota bacterium]
MPIVVDPSSRRSAVLVTAFEPLDPRTDFAELAKKTDAAWYEIREPVIYQIINLQNHELSERGVRVLLREMINSKKKADYDIRSIIVADIPMMHLINETIDQFSGIGQTPVFDGLDDAYSYIDGERVRLGIQPLDDSYDTDQS